MCGVHPGGRATGSFVHEALLCGEDQQAVEAARDFVRGGARDGEPALLIVRPERLSALRGALGDEARSVCLEDVTAVGVNPGRLLPRIDKWLGAQTGPARVVTEPLWPGRRSAERIEVIRHEALLNLAQPGRRGKLLCLYGQDVLDPETRKAVERNHPSLLGPDLLRRPNPAYAAPEATLTATERPLPPPEEPLEEVTVTEDLHDVRTAVAATSQVCALPAERKADFVIAINEVATNALKYNRPPRTITLWRSRGYVVGQVEARGEVEDPLAGRRMPRLDAVQGRGLWMVNQLCDLVQLRNQGCRATLRIHMRCP